MCSCNNNCNNNISHKGNVVSVAAKSLLLKDATIVQNACAAASAASSPTPVFAIAPIIALNASSGFFIVDENGLVVLTKEESEAYDELIGWIMKHVGQLKFSGLWT